MLPNVIIIGAQKCGTSALYYYLAHHPEVHMSRQKELRFFYGPNRDRGNWERGIDWYEAHFAGARTPIAGEASPQYTHYPRVSGVAERMHAVIPDAKLIYLVRDPLERLPSGYVERLSNGGNPRKLTEEFAVSPRSHAVWVSSYATQLEQYLAYYPPERILVLAQEDLLNRRRETLRETFRFLGVDESIESPAFDEIRNPSAPKRRMRVRGPLLPTGLNPTPTGRIPWEVRARARRTLLKPLSAPIERPTLDGELRHALSALLKGEVDRLREMTGKEFADWSV